MEKDVLLSDLKRLGIKEGMNLMVHSSLRNIGANSKELDASGVIDCLLELLGPRGTLIMPTISGSVNPGQPVFHVEYTPSTVGYLTNAFRRRPDAVRSAHPVHSAAALGPMAGFFTRGHAEANTPWSPDTPYGRVVRDDNSGILFLGVSLTCNTCFHALEIEAGIPGLHTSESTLLRVIDNEGAVRGVEHHWHSPGTRRFFSDMEYLLCGAGCLQWGRTGRGISRLVKAAPMRDVILKVLAEEPWIMTRGAPDNPFIWEP